MVPTRQSTITTETESLWKAQESANVPMLPKRAKSVRSQLIEDLIEELKPICLGSSQSERLAIYCAAKAEIERLESLPAGYSAADLLHQRVDAPSPAQSNVFGTPDAMAVVRKLQVPYNWRKGMTLAFEYEGEEIELVAPEGTQPGDMVRITLPRRAKPPPGGAPPSPIDAPPPLGSTMPTTAPPPSPAGGAASAPLPPLGQPPSEPDVVKSSSAEELRIALAMSMASMNSPAPSPPPCDA
jgi:hypothetical protein